MKSDQPNFRAEFSFHDAFHLRGDLLRPGFGMWDCLDPVAHVILDLVEAQKSSYGVDCEEAFKAAIDKRHDIARKLLAALEDRSAWPDPDFGRR